MNKEYAVETTVKSGIGMFGSVASWNLSAYNQLASLVVAVLTAVYLVVQIYKASKK